MSDLLAGLDVHQDADGEWRNAYGNVVVCGECRRRIEPDGTGYRHRCSHHDWDEPAPALDNTPECPDGARFAWQGITKLVTGNRYLGVGPWL
jgi:hypothetical protein